MKTKFLIMNISIFLDAIESNKKIIMNQACNSIYIELMSLFEKEQMVLIHYSSKHEDIAVHLGKKLEAFQIKSRYKEESDLILSNDYIASSVNTMNRSENDYRTKPIFYAIFLVDAENIQNYLDICPEKQILFTRNIETYSSAEVSRDICGN